MKIMSTRCGGTYMETKRNQQIHTYTHTHSRHTDNANTLRSQLNFYSTPQTKRIPAYLVRENESIFSCNFNWIDATECSRAVYILYTLRSLNHSGCGTWLRLARVLILAQHWLNKLNRYANTFNKTNPSMLKKHGPKLWLVVDTFFFTLACISNLFKR